jgi:proliferating cell nuclear antigen
MFEAKLSEGHIFKKIIESLKDLVKSVNFDANNTGLSMQAMDSSHVALVSFFLHESGFSSYRCDKPLTLGLSIENLAKILKCAGNDDTLSLQAEEDPSSIRFTFENQKGDKFSEFNLNLL